MKILFTIDSDGTGEIQDIIGFSDADIPVAKVWPYLRTATREIIDIIGKDNYDICVQFSEKENEVIPEEPEDPKTTDVTFSKVEVNGSAELPGASLKVVSGETADGQIATDAKTGENLAWTSGDTAKVFSLSEGAYTMVESQAPAGYDLAESITFRVTADGQVEVKGTDGSWTVQADAIIKMEDAKTPVIPEKNSQIPQQLMIQQLRQVILINNQRRNKKRNHSFRQQEIAAV